LSDDAETIADLTCFPFITGWLSIDNMKDKYDRKDFIAEYKIFGSFERRYGKDKI